MSWWWWWWRRGGYHHLQHVVEVPGARELLDPLEGLPHPPQLALGAPRRRVGHRAYGRRLGRLRLQRRLRLSMVDGEQRRRGVSRRACGGGCGGGVRWCAAPRRPSRQSRRVAPSAAPSPAPAMPRRERERGREDVRERQGGCEREAGRMRERRREDARERGEGQRERELIWAAACGRARACVVLLRSSLRRQHVTTSLRSAISFCCFT